MANTDCLLPEIKRGLNTKDLKLLIPMLCILCKIFELTRMSEFSFKDKESAGILSVTCPDCTKISSKSSCQCQGITFLFSSFKSYFLSFNQGARLELMQRPGLTKTDKQLVRTGFVHIALALGSKEKVDEITVRLKNNGYCIISNPRTTGDGYYESCFLDLEGNQIELTV